MNYQTALIRHIISTISYRMAHTLENSDENFASFRVGDGSRTPLELMRHMNHLLIRLIEAYGVESEMLLLETSNWYAEVEYFFKLLTELDHAVVETEEPQLIFTVEQVIQGPLSDILTHIGQLAMLRRLFGKPVQSVSFIKADIQAGKLRRMK